MPTYNNTTRLSIRKPQANQKVNDFTAILGALADDTDAKTLGWLTGLDAALPAAGTAGRFYYATDTHNLYFDTGSGWITVSAPVPWQTVTPETSFSLPTTNPARVRQEGDVVRFKGTVKNNTGSTITGTTSTQVPLVAINSGSTIPMLGGGTFIAAMGNGGTLVLQALGGLISIYQGSVPAGLVVYLDPVVYATS